MFLTLIIAQTIMTSLSCGVGRNQVVNSKDGRICSSRNKINYGSEALTEYYTDDRIKKNVKEISYTDTTEKISPKKYNSKLTVKRNIIQIGKKTGKNKLVNNYRRNVAKRKMVSSLRNNILLRKKLLVKPQNTYFKNSNKKLQKMELTNSKSYLAPSKVCIIRRNSNETSSGPWHSDEKETETCDKELNEFQMKPPNKGTYLKQIGTNLLIVDDKANKINSSLYLKTIFPQNIQKEVKLLEIKTEDKKVPQEAYKDNSEIEMYLFKSSKTKEKNNKRDDSTANLNTEIPCYISNNPTETSKKQNSTTTEIDEPSNGTIWSENNWSNDVVPFINEKVNDDSQLPTTETSNYFLTTEEGSQNHSVMNDSKEHMIYHAEKNQDNYFTIDTNISLTTEKSYASSSVSKDLSKDSEIHFSITDRNHKNTTSDVKMNTETHVLPTKEYFKTSPSTDIISVSNFQAKVTERNIFLKTSVKHTTNVHSSTNNILEPVTLSYNSSSNELVKVSPSRDAIFKTSPSTDIISVSNFQAKVTERNIFLKTSVKHTINVHSSTNNILKPVALSYNSSSNELVKVSSSRDAIFLHLSSTNTEKTTEPLPSNKERHVNVINSSEKAKKKETLDNIIRDQRVKYYGYGTIDKLPVFLSKYANGNLASPESENLLVKYALSRNLTTKDHKNMYGGHKDCPFCTLNEDRTKTTVYVCCPFCHNKLELCVSGISGKAYFQNIKKRLAKQRNKQRFYKTMTSHTQF